MIDEYHYKGPCFFRGSPCEISDDKCVSGCPPTTTAIYYQLSVHY